ncbi:MAG: hypothetical protein KKF48_00465 [Nanoarchaeota archaeon]|nr:hypothetical protein [Nanoarchaeota archaeon]MBU1027498.1 hypothetical protein [Nanoarchaeota archaeon]
MKKRAVKKKKSKKKRPVKKKKKIKKSKSAKKVSKPTITKSSSDFQIEKILVHNFVSLQKVIVNLSTKIDNLTTRITKLLDLFELSAKALADKNPHLGKPKENKEIMEKIEKLLDQNKTIAKGITTIHEKSQNQSLPPQQQKFIESEELDPESEEPEFEAEQIEPESEESGFESDDYQKSISSEFPESEEFQQ